LELSDLGENVASWKGESEAIVANKFDGGRAAMDETMMAFHSNTRVFLVQFHNN
jgi:hypothetical protein